jgi:hypothetical protein
LFSIWRRPKPRSLDVVIAPRCLLPPDHDLNGSRRRFSNGADGNQGHMAVAPQGTASNYLQRAPSPSGLADVIDLILDKGLVIDAYVRVAVIGIELITIDARVVIASVDTYLRFAEAVNRLDLNQTEMAGIDALREGGSAAKEEGEGVVQGAKKALSRD